MSLFSNKNILIISPDKWSELYVSKQHYARYLSKNNTVWFLNAIGDYKLEKKISIQKHDDYNIYIIDYKPFIRGINKLPTFILNLLLKFQIGIIKKAINVPLDVVWSFDPNRFWNLSFWKVPLKIYHTVDFHYKARFENISCQTADVVFGVADLIIEPIKHLNSKTFKISHGVDYDELAPKKKVTEFNIPGKNKIKAVYLGNFHRDVNYKLLSQLSEENKAVDFILIGPYKGDKMGSLKIKNEDYEMLSKQNNIFFIGELKSYDILSYLEKIDINLLLFNDDAQVKHCNPHKLLFYLLSGKVIISNKIDEYKNSDLLVSVDSIDLYKNEFKKVVNNIEEYNSNENQLKRIAFAKENTYVKQLERIETIINTIKNGQL